jgi:4a-hydroxytetrahydrobiopterin dehydratase
MTETLAEKTCTPCRGGVPPLARDEALHFQKQAPDWELRDDAHRIERTFRFRNFREALAFVQQVGELAETEGHHPDISFGWDRATVSLSTKKIKGLHENDFIMASKIDRMLDRPQWLRPEAVIRKPWARFPWRTSSPLLLNLIFDRDRH